MSTANISDLFDSARSLFIYHPNLNKEVVANLAYDDATKNLKTLTKLEVQYLYDTGFFSLSDLHIVKIVAKHVFVTQSMVKKYIDYNNKYADGVNRVYITSDIDNIKNRLTNLVKAGVLTRYIFYTYHYEHTDKLMKMSYYLVSPHGYNYIKRILNYKEPYDEYLAVWPIEEVFKFLVVNTVCQRFLTEKSFKEYNIDFPFYIKELKSKERIYAVIDVAVEDGSKKVIVEPFKLNYNNMRISENEFKMELNNRFKVLKEYIQFLQGNGYVSNDIIFVCEDFKGIKQAAKMATHYLPEYLDNIYYTTDVMATCYRPEIAYVKLKNNSLITSSPEYISKEQE